MTPVPIGGLPPDTIPIVTEPVANKLRPTSDYDAKFSIQFIVAACIARGRFTLAELEDEALKDPVILGLADKVVAEADPDMPFPKYFSGGVVITTTDGRELVHQERINRGAGERALMVQELEKVLRQIKARLAKTDDPGDVEDLSFERDELTLVIRSLSKQKG